MPMHVVITGATGMVGREVLEQCLADDRVDRVTAIGRRPTGVSHDKLTEHATRDFAEPQSYRAALRRVDAVLFCMGAYTGAVSDDEFRKVTLDWPVAFGRATAKAKRGARFVLLSGAGADRTEKSRISFARYKGGAENALAEIKGLSFFALRPGYIHPTRPRKAPNLSYRIFGWLWPLVRGLSPTMGIESRDLARGIVKVGLEGHSAQTLENAQILALLSGS